MIEGKFINLFPTIVLSNKLNREFTFDELNCILDYQDKLNPITGNITSQDMYVLDNEKLFELKSFCQEVLDEYFIKVYNPINPNDVRLQITQSWLNFTSEDKFHEKHRHFNSVISGIIYINANRENDSIIFTKLDSEDFWQIQPKELNEYNSRNCFFKVGTKDIIIFPSNLYHSTPQTNNNYLRISLAFSSFITGTIGYIEGPIKGINELKIKI